MSAQAVARSGARSARSWVGSLCVITTIGAGCVVVAAPAFAGQLAGTQPTVTKLSQRAGAYWGATRIFVTGSNFVDVTKVLFGQRAGLALRVLSPSRLVVLDPWHNYGTVHVRVITATGTSPATPADRFTFAPPTMHTPIMGGLTARQEQRISAQVRAAHHDVRIARRARRWTPAMGDTAMRRARSWLGLPYSWAGGSFTGPTRGVCAHNGGDLDCHVVGFDCSGLSLYSWSPYEQLTHRAAIQYGQAGRFHPLIGQLMPGDLVFFSGYIPNGIGHVAVYVGNGMVIQAAQSGTQVMRSRLVDVIAESGVYRGATRPMSTGRQGRGPLVASLSTQVPASGGDIRITGDRLSSVTAVSVGGTMLYSFAKHAAHRLVVKVPAHEAGRVPISVYNAWGTAHRSINYIPTPSLTSLTPPTGPASGGTTVTVTGQYLATVNQLTLDGQAVPFQPISADQLSFTTPAHAPGSVPVVVSSTFGTSAPVPFTFTSSARSRTGSPPSTPSRTRSSRTRPATTTPRGARNAPLTAAEPTTARARDRFFEDRVGEYWYLVGRLLTQRSNARGCIDRSGSQLVGCLERAALP